LKKLWAGTATIHPGSKTGAHHHGELESVNLRDPRLGPDAVGREPRIHRRSWPGEFIVVPPFVSHQ
jgi:uncharacterized RmlC-like cupin family protein